MPSSNGSLVIAIKQKAYICASTMLFYRLQEIKMYWLFVPSFMKISQLVPKLSGHTQTHNGDLISLLLFLLSKESRLKGNLYSWKQDHKKPNIMKMKTPTVNTAMISQ
jgi:hypothetical protein